jgi:hypothetical protein
MAAVGEFAMADHWIIFHALPSKGKDGEARSGVPPSS